MTASTPARPPLLEIGAAPEAPGQAGRLAAIGAPLVRWLVDSALPLWSTAGVDRVRGGFFEKIGLDGRPIEAPRRARVVARQIYVFATAATQGWLAGADELVDHGLEFLLNRMRTPDRTIAAAVTSDGGFHDARFDLYEHAFVLFALAAAYRRGRNREALKSEAEALLTRMRGGWGHPVIGFEEAAPRVLPLRSNPHMHLLEAALAWAEVTEGESRAHWTRLADELVALCLDRFIGANGALREYFDGDWQPMPGATGRVVEPGHQFEWAWLLMRSGGAHAQRRRDAAMRLLEIGESQGVDPRRGVAVNALDDDFGVTDSAAKLWPQTERIKAWHLVASTTDALQAPSAEAALRRAVVGLQRYLVSSPAGLWREQMEADGRFDVPDCRASSLYHIVCAIDTLAGKTDAPGPGANRFVPPEAAQEKPLDAWHEGRR